MDIENSKYYDAIMQPLRSPELKRNMTMGAEGFSYKSERIALTLHRLSKNNYRLYVLFALEEEEKHFTGITAAVERAKILIDLDRAGKL